MNLTKLSDDTILVLYAIGTILTFVSGRIFSLLQAIILSQDAATTLATYETVVASVSIVATLPAIIMRQGTITLLGRADGAGDFQKAGHMMKMALWISFRLGTVCAILVSLLRDPIIELYNESGELLSNAAEVLLVSGIGLIVSLPSGAVLYIFSGLFKIGWLLLLSFLGSIVFIVVGFLVFLYTDLGVYSFVVALIFRDTVELAVGCSVFATRSFQEKYNFYWCRPAIQESGLILDGSVDQPLEAAGDKPKTSFTQTLREILLASRGISVQSLAFTLNTFLTLLLITRSGAVQAAIFIVIRRLSNTLAIGGEGIGRLVPWIGPRLLGTGDVGGAETRKQLKKGEPNYSSLLSFISIAVGLVMLWTVLVASVSAITGKNIFLSAGAVTTNTTLTNSTREMTLNEFEPFVTDSLFVLFLGYLIGENTVALFEGILYAAHDFNFLGLQSGVAAFLIYLPIMLVNTFEDQSLELYLLGDVAFRLSRTVFCAARWFLFLQQDIKIRAKEQGQTENSNSRFQVAVRRICCGQTYSEIVQIKEDLLAGTRGNTRGNRSEGVDL